MAQLHPAHIASLCSFPGWSRATRRGFCFGRDPTLLVLGDRNSTPSASRASRCLAHEKVSPGKPRDMSGPDGGRASVPASTRRAISIGFRPNQPGDCLGSSAAFGSRAGLRMQEGWSVTEIESMVVVGPYRPLLHEPLAQAFDGQCLSRSPSRPFGQGGRDAVPTWTVPTRSPN